MAALTKAERREVAAVFAAATLHLWDGVSDAYGRKQSSFICYAIDNGSPNSKARRYAKGVIRRRLGRGAPTMQWWLMEQRIPLDDMTTERVQAHRKAWLEKLIEEFST